MPDSVSSPASSTPDWRQAPKVRAWEKALLDAGCTLQELELLQGLRKRDQSLLFALVQAKGKDPEGRPLLPYALLRGSACVVVPAITVAETGEELLLTVWQRRIAHGRLSLEFPAGMLDETLHDPVGVARRELEEETGLVVRREQLLPLVQRPLYSSPGLSDESIWFYVCPVTLTRKQCDTFHGSDTGAAHEGEHIRVALMTRQELAVQTDSLQTRLALHLFEAWKKSPT